MSFSKISALTGFAALVSQVSAHGLVTGIVADGIYYQGYDTNFQYMTSAPDVVGWSIPEDQGRGPITPDQYASSDIICHLGATNAKASAPVAAGGKVELQWTTWPESHHGPVIDYLADCGGDCTTVDKTTLKWFKIDAGGLVDDSVVPGTWASDQLIANNNSWTVTIPSDIASGNYVLRHEIIALHSAGEANGAQNYPQCVNLQITGTGTATPSTSGTLGTALYTATDAGILVNIYTTLASYLIPGPALYSGAATESQSAVPAATSVASSAAVIASSAAVVETSAAVETTAVAEVASTSSAAAAVTTQVPVVTAAPFSNSTVATSSKKSKSACKAKTSAIAVSASTKKTKSACKAKSTAVAAASSLTVSALNVNAAVPTVSASVSAEIQTTSAASVTIATSAPTSTAESTTSSVTEPEGTTLNDLLSWLSSFFSSHEGKSYDANTVARRHARDIAQRDMDKFSAQSGKAHATGTATRSAGAHPTHHHTRPSGTGHASGKGHAKPTGSFVLGSPMPTDARHFQAAGY